ncbi:hypothetical protein NX773_01585 [Massilia solisilvae]|uniref:Lipoprotein n=1 Tax=Massilia solisilvae TaxID=1811225 RepID=A0ABT2BEL4_9BURK|nr:hypothetical protein [Massilia solisilvae]MCS0606856.1 hypothetical protein [Massilia solisilvae]
MPAFSRLFAIPAAVALTCALASCKREQPAPPKPVAPAAAPAAQAPTKEQAMTSLMEVPEIAAWAAQIEKSSRGKVHGAIIEDNPQPRIINGKPYWQLSFVENRPDTVHRRASFLVAQAGGEVLVEDPLSDKLLTLTEWRRTVRKVLANTSE